MAVGISGDCQDTPPAFSCLSLLFAPDEPDQKVSATILLTDIETKLPRLTVRAAIPKNG